MGALFLTEQDVSELLDIRSTIKVVDAAFRQWADGKLENVPRRRAQSTGFVLHSMSAAAEYLSLACWKQYATTRAGARFHVGLYDTTNGKLAALIEANRLGQLRTGAATAVAVGYMAAQETSEMGLFGAGYQAESQLEAVAAVLPLKRVFVYSRDANRREAFAERMAARLNLEIEPVDRPQLAAEEVPLVVTATSSREPVFSGEWLDENALVCAVGSNWLHKAEIDSVTVRRADHIVCDSIEACQHEAGDFVEAIERGNFSWDRAVNLADVVAGRAVGRSHAPGIRLFKSVGLAMEDLAAAAEVLKRAHLEGRGTVLPL